MYAKPRLVAIGSLSLCDAAELYYAASGKAQVAQDCGDVSSRRIATGSRTFQMSRDAMKLAEEE
jgi:hypothetical protein